MISFQIVAIAAAERPQLRGIYFEQGVSCNFTEGKKVMVNVYRQQNSTQSGIPKDNDIKGSKKDDDLAGSERNDRLIGYLGDDTIKGGLGNDTVTGNQGKDVFGIGLGLGTDIITDFCKGHDLVALSNGLTFADLEISQGTGNQRRHTLIYHPASGELLAVLKNVNAQTLDETDFINEGNIPPKNTPPAAGDDVVTTLEDSQVTIAVLENDSDEKGEILSIAGVTSPENGTVTFDGTSLTYTPHPNFSGMDQFLYTVVNESGETDTATVEVNVTAVADSPSLSVENAIGNRNTAIPVQINAALTDTDGSEVLEIIISGMPAGATLSAGTDNGDGSWTLSPTDLENLSITAENIGNSTLSVTTSATETANTDIRVITETLSLNVVEPVNAMDDMLGAVLLGTPLQIPIANLLANDTEGDPTTLQLASVENAVNGSVSLNDGVVTFQPLPGYTGTASFDYTVTDAAGNESNATVSLNVVSQLELNAIASQLRTPTGTGGFIIQGINWFDYTGFSVSDAGDINGDGLADVIVGAPYSDPNNNTRSGAAYVVFGKADGAAVDLNQVIAGYGGFAINGANVGDAAGWQVSGGGDINGDGLADIVLGASFASVADKFIAGKSYVIFGKTDTTTVDLNEVNAGNGGFVMNGVDFADRAGVSASDAGDVNGDGLNDLIVGAYAAEYNISTSAGEAYLVFGKTDGNPIELSEVAAGNGGFLIEGTGAFDKLGSSVSRAGDINGDGLDDFMVAAFEGDVIGGTNAGEIYVVFGKTDTTAVNVNEISAGTNGFIINGIDAFDKAGTSVKNAGDVNGDGLEDMIVGAPGGDVGTQLDAGEAYVIFGKTDSTAVNLADIATGIGGFIINGNSAYDAAGTSVSGAGDVNGDGFDDLIVGATGGDPNNLYDAGETYIIFGKSDTTAVNLSEVAAGTGGFVLNGSRMYDNAGQSVSGAGDLNGDGFDDVILGAPGYYSFYSPIYEGDSYVVFGGDFTASVTQQGSEGVDNLTGIREGEILIGAQGNDILSDGGFANVILNGSAGDDVLGINSVNFRQLKGGLGTDTLRLETAGMSLDLTTIPDSKIAGIELIDLAGNGNSLTLGITDLIQLSDTSSTLRILGTSENTIRGNFAGFTSSNLEGFTTYTNGNINLVVEDTINQAGIVV